MRRSETDKSQAASEAATANHSSHSMVTPAQVSGAGSSVIQMRSMGPSGSRSSGGMRQCFQPRAASEPGPNTEIPAANPTPW